VSVPVLFRPEAEADLNEAFLWYYERGQGLGAEFIRSIDAAVNLIARQPESQSTVHREVRRILLRRFPYGLFYRYDGSQVLVLGCFHASRNPQLWKTRAER